MTILRVLLLILMAALGVSAQSLTLYTANLNHGQGTDGNFNFARQVAAFPGADIITVEERTTTETGWNSSLTAAGLVQAVYLENNTTEGDGPAIWYNSSTVTINTTYTHPLNTGTNPSCGTANVGWDCTTDVRKSAVAAKITISGRQLYIVGVHLCWSRCANSNGSTTSVQRENQANDLVSWISSTLTDAIPIVLSGDLNFGPDYPKSTGGLIKDIITTAGYADQWDAGITASTATAGWGDRDADSVTDMPVGSLTTRTHDTRRIDYIFLKGTGIGLTSIAVPDSRATCSVALTNSQPPGTSTVKECPDVLAPSMLWDITDDQGVRASDHNFVTAVFSLGQLKCRFHTLVRCQ